MEAACLGKEPPKWKRALSTLGQEIKEKSTEMWCSGARQLILRLNELNDKLSQAGPVAGLAQAFDGRRRRSVSPADLTPPTRRFTRQLHPSEAPSRGRSDMKQSSGWFPATGAARAAGNRTASAHGGAAPPAGPEPQPEGTQRR